jgi:hypothetical protein
LPNESRLLMREPLPPNAADVNTPQDAGADAATDKVPWR